ncbi:MAG: radical SAM protein [Clostridiales bacterium]|nr:radical SAM protein [Clostridiales bacterium]
MMERQIKQVHFQITRNCNLRCPFCGQWGKKGFFADSSGRAMTIDDWKRITAELASCQKEENITVTLWGGEPLISPYFDEIIALLKEQDLKTEVITNGVLINEHKDVLRKYADRIYVSLDGTKEVHDAIRGRGVFERVTQSLKTLKHKNVTVMSVITPQLMEVLPKFLDNLDELNIQQLYL